MLRSLWLLFIYISFLGVSFNAPFVATLGYVWVDTFQPQGVAYIILSQIPVAMVMGAAAFGLYLAFDRKSPPRPTMIMTCQLTLALWCTLSMSWAVAPELGWEKWDWAFKTLIFSAFIPFAIRSRVQIEAFVQTWLFSLAANFIPFGVKTLISGGGYGTNLGLVKGNAGLAEGGLLSTACLMAVPLAVYLSKHSQLIPKSKLMLLGYWGLAGLAIATAIGTYERSALVGLIALGIYMWTRSKQKLQFGIIGAVVACLIMYSTSSAWNARIETIGHMGVENSANVRILVWKWTLGFSATHPFGGGFMAFVVNHIEVPTGEGQATEIQNGRAFHSIYFEMLGEQGYPGVLLFLLITVGTFVKLRRMAAKARGYPELEWLVGLADALQSGLVVFLTSGAFVGIVYQPMYWYFVAMGVSLSAYMWRVENEQATPVAGWRGVVGRTANAPPLGPKVVGWRGRGVRLGGNVISPRR